MTDKPKFPYVKIVPLNPLYESGRKWEVRLFRVTDTFGPTKVLRADTKWGAKRLARKMLRDARTPSKRKEFTVR